MLKTYKSQTSLLKPIVQTWKVVSHCPHPLLNIQGTKSWQQNQLHLQSWTQARTQTWRGGSHSWSWHLYTWVGSQLICHYSVHLRRSGSRRSSPPLQLGSWTHWCKGWSQLMSMGKLWCRRFLARTSRKYSAIKIEFPKILMEILSISFGEVNCL